MERTKWRRKDNDFWSGCVLPSDASFGENDDGRIREWTASAKQGSYRSRPSLPTEITRALRADNRIIAADIFLFRDRVFLLFVDSPHFSTRVVCENRISGEDARGDYRSDKSAFETLNLGFETGAFLL